MARTSARGGPVRITSAPTSHLEEINHRQKRYLISMGIRTVCVILAVVATGPLRWAFIIGAVVLPYVAVVMANAGARLDRGAPEPYIDESRLLPGPDAGSTNGEEPPTGGRPDEHNVDDAGHHDK